MAQKNGLIERLRAYNLIGNLWVMLAIAIATAVSVAWYVHTWDDPGVVGNLALAVATSFMATFLIYVVQTYLDYMNRRNEKYLLDIRKMGIGSLHFDKQVRIAKLLDNAVLRCKAVGYRYILTADLSEKLEDLLARGGSLELLIVPPWAEAFKAVYGDKERIAGNYLTVMYAAMRGVEKRLGNTCVYGTDTSVLAKALQERVKIRFVDRPIFNDTYMIDDTIITGPYLHNTDKCYGKISAKDFFTYELLKGHPPFKLIHQEVETLWDEADEQLRWDRFMEVKDYLVSSDLNDKEKQDALKSVLEKCEGLGKENCAIK
ncbi:hypothetical protein ACUH94_06665 [Dermabacteraceae bacterium P7074]